MNSKINFGRVSPSFMIIGVQKGGTSSLYHYLTQHPQLISPEKKELHYFDTFQDTPPKPYLNYFPASYFTNKLSFEATPRYIYYPGTAKKIYDFDSNMKFIVLLRDPVKRAYSAWNMYRDMVNNAQLLAEFKEQEEKNELNKAHTFFYASKFPSFEAWVKTETASDFPIELIEPSIVKRGYYKEQIEIYFKYFKKEQFYFIDIKDLKENTVQVLNKVSAFLKISSFDKLNLNLEIKNKRAYKQEISADLYQFLLKHYQIKNEGLEDLVKLNLKWMHT